MDCETEAARQDKFCTAPTKPRVESVLEWRALENCVTANYSIAELERRWERFDAFAGRSQYRMQELPYSLHLPPPPSATARAKATAIATSTAPASPAPNALEASSLETETEALTPTSAQTAWETKSFALRVEYLPTGDRATLWSRVALAPGVYSVLVDEWARRADDRSLLHATRHVIKIFVSNYTTFV